MQSDFEKERKHKKKAAIDIIKFIKKNINNKHIEKQKQIKREKIELLKKANLISKQVGFYWKKIEKLAKYEYSVALKEDQEEIKRNKLVNFINSLQKISTKVASYLTSDSQISNINYDHISDSNQNKSVAISNLSSINTTNDFTIVLKRHNPNNYSIIEINEENLFANAAQNAQLFQPKGFDLAHCSVNLTAPFLIKFPLREYQLIGLNWLSALHDNKINGILADEMGLGKTIQTISLIAHLACNKGIWGPHLIIVPTTIIINWEIEFKKWCPNLKILSYYGNQKERKIKRTGWQKSNAFNVCIASYKLIIQDFSNFKRKKWYYLILDEAQNIKNFKSKRWQMLLNLKAKRKLLLSGTPLQNDVMEIWSYLHFLMPNLFYSNDDFRDWFHSQFHDALNKNSALNKQLLNSLHSILRPFLLRRLKKDVEKQLPEKKEHIIKCELTRRQKFIYDEYINSDKTQDTLQKNDYFSIMNVLMQLRKVCNHPDLFEARDYVTPTKQIIDLEYNIPSLVVDLFDYNPLEDLNFKKLNMILEDKEKLSMLEYFTLLSLFPERQANKVYEDFHNNKIRLSTPNYVIKEDDIVFKRQYTDSTIFYNSNSQVITNFMNKLKSSGEDSLIKQSDLFNEDAFIPHYLCPSNIPLIKNNSLQNYFDVFNPNDNDKSYLKSHFYNNIKENKHKKYVYKKNLFLEYDNISRNNILFSKPIYGRKILNLIKFNLCCENVFANKNIIYGNYKYSLLKSNVNNSQVLNKYCKSLLNMNNNFNNTTLEEELIMSPNNKLNTITNNEIQQINKENENNEELSSLNNLKTNHSNKSIPYITSYKTNYFVQTNYSPLESICFINSDSLSEMILTPSKLLNITEDIINYFHIYVPKIISKSPKLCPSKFKYSQINRNKKYQTLYNNLNKIPSVLKYFSILKTISFPDKRLIEYDSGKLIKLSNLLKNLRYNKSKCLIFTQMTKMLDILEVFLNIHGYTYVRLDGSTKVEVRQAIVDRFNSDNRVFCFISSTRSGGIGLNLTGADSIVFYDTDWNPAMDKQAQDRCHRIGQTRTVNIYRLITSKTIEENIFKKSIQKRELSHIVMENGQFDIDQLKENKIDFKNIVFEEGLLKNTNQAKQTTNKSNMMDFENIKFENEEDQKNIESMLIKIEDKEDVQAYKYASLEILDAYERENNEQKFIKNDDINVKIYILSLIFI